MGGGALVVDGAEQIGHVRKSAGVVVVVVRVFQDLLGRRECVVNIGGCSGGGEWGRLNIAK